MHRRDLLKLIPLSVLAGASAPLLAGSAREGPGRAVGAGGGAGVAPVAVDAALGPVDGAAALPVVSALYRSGGAILGRIVDRPGNLALSPYSIAVALAMTANGAAGVTRAQLEQAIGGLTVETANAGIPALTRHLESLAGARTRSGGRSVEVRLDAANALFGQRDVEWERPFLASLAEHYGAGVNTVDFARATEQARAAVNAWTAERTHDKIPEILAPGSVDVVTRLVLVNALYLKAPWATPFERALTEHGDFELPGGSIIRTPMMRGTLAVAMGSGHGWRSVRLLYAGRQIAMTVVLPDADRYEDVEADVVAGRLADYLVVPGSALRLVDLSLPRWTVRTSALLMEPLIELGVEAPFKDADFTAMTEEDLDLYVSEVVHEVCVEVDEGGTEAAAATAVVVAETVAVAPDATRFAVDRSFLFVVHDVAYGTPLFVGRVLDPRS